MHFHAPSPSLGKKKDKSGSRKYAVKKNHATGKIYPLLREVPLI
jgi:hypothetical protein